MKLIPDDLRGRSVLDAGWYTEQLLKRGGGSD